MQTITTMARSRRVPDVRQAALGAAVTPALAAASTASSVRAQSNDIVDLDDWDPTTIEGLWSADQLDELEVRGAGGETIGEVESVIVGADDNVAAVVLEIGGLLDIGDTHLRVDWSDVTVAPPVARRRRPRALEVDERARRPVGVVDPTDQASPLRERAAPSPIETSLAVPPEVLDNRSTSRSPTSSSMPSDSDA